MGRIGRRGVGGFPLTFPRPISHVFPKKNALPIVAVFTHCSPPLRWKSGRKVNAPPLTEQSVSARPCPGRSTDAEREGEGVDWQGPGDTLRSA